MCLHFDFRGWICLGNWVGDEITIFFENVLGDPKVAQNYIYFLKKNDWNSKIFLKNISIFARHNIFFSSLYLHFVFRGLILWVNEKVIIWWSLFLKFFLVIKILSKLFPLEYKMNLKIYFWKIIWFLPDILCFFVGYTMLIFFLKPYSVIKMLPKIIFLKKIIEQQDIFHLYFVLTK